MATEILMNRPRVERTVHRMAHELAEHVVEKPLLLVGINEGGLALAGTLHQSMERFALGNSVVVPLNTANQHDESLERIQSHKGVIVLCDDVIFSGKTLFDVLTTLPLNEKIEAVLIASLIDRGHRSYPITPTVCGLSLPTKEGEHITVKLAEEIKLKEVRFSSLDSVELELSE